MAPPRIIGLDLDNTVIDYTNAYSAVAAHLGLPEECRTRHQIRRLLRKSPPNDFEWQEFQALLYTEGLEHATPANGLHAFLETCAVLRVTVAIVSHKTENTPQRFGAEDLRAPALLWLDKHGVVPDYIMPSDIHFCPTRQLKIEAIRNIQADVFVDDLTEVLMDPAMPRNILRWHFQSDLSVAKEAVPNLPAADFPRLTEWIQTC